MQNPITFVLSDSRRVNNHGFRTDLGGMDLSRFKTNPVMLYQHDPERVVGRWENVRIEDARLLADAVFDADDTLAAEVCRKVEAGFLRGCSIGLTVHDMQEVDGDYVATRSELFEASIVSVPADAGAVRLYDKNHEILSADALYLQFSITNHNPHEQMETMEQLQATVAEQNSRIATLSAEAESLRNENEALRRERTDMLLNAAVQDGRIRESERTLYATLAQQDYGTVCALLQSMPAAPASPVPTSLSGMMHRAPKQETGRETWSYLDWAKNDPEGLCRLRAEHPEQFAELAGRA